MNFSLKSFQQKLKVTKKETPKLTKTKPLIKLHSKRHEKAAKAEQR